MTKKLRQILIDDLLHAGELCANCCFNVAQNDDLPEDTQQSLKESQRLWDTARSAYRQAVTRDGAFTMVSVLWFTALATVTAGLIFFHYLRELAL